ncbi:primosomal protein N' [Weissella coleopterorum]|uniref:Replication restart protein PriA n=1 Tax=Weissella coleopterorum TaxID=2714949 RepID=A0A6G8B088_9LACO|nr:primosomal protein N' [Weissella coleopterorum]QIL50640.1 primosomal protein N' [Weissella coleopterorum]
MDVAKIIVDVSTRQTNKPWTYQIPENLRLIVQPGVRVQVPFGNGGRQIQGFVLEVTTVEVVSTKIKPITNVLDLEPVLNPELLKLSAQIADHNFNFRISILQAMLPNVMKAKYQKSLVLFDSKLIDDEQVKDLFVDRDEIPFDLDSIPVELISKIKHYQGLKALGFNYYLKDKARVKKVKKYKNLLTAEQYDQMRKNLKKNAQKKARFLTYLMQHVTNDWKLVSDLQKHLNLTSQDITLANQNGWITLTEMETYRQPLLSSEIQSTQALELNSEQQDAFAEISAALMQQKPQTFLLEGVTGSGKTEIYLQAIAQTIAAGKTALFLVPEITLTPQMVRRVKGRFGDDVALLHSALSDGERYDEWRRIQRQEVHVVVGVRSAIFAPLNHIGLIIMDEEHESSYKQDDNPRYHAREIATWRAKYHQSVLILGSATPSLESRARAQKKVYQLLRLKKRALDNPLPEAKIIDMSEVMKQNGDEIFSPQLKIEIEDRLEKKEQVILMLNRRGYANFMMCRDCGYVPMCPNCDLALTMHKDTQRMECHVCGAMEPIPHKCSECGSSRIRPFGTGTQKVEEQLQTLYPQAKIIRMDNDTTRRKGATDRLLEEFGAQKADILIGTQMIAKGLDFPNVTLVGVLNADTTLKIPDYRASERTFQLITQVAGRAGRANKAGSVVIQTFNPNHYAIRLAQTQDYESFYQQEMALRKNWRYSPYYYAIQIKLTHPNEIDVAKISYQIVDWLKDKVGSDTMIFGPAPGAIRRVKNRYIYQILLRYQFDTGLEEILNTLVTDAQKMIDKNIQISINRDPINL